MLPVASVGEQVITGRNVLLQDTDLCSYQNPTQPPEHFASPMLRQSAAPCVHHIVAARLLCRSLSCTGMSIIQAAMQTLSIMEATNSRQIIWSTYRLGFSLPTMSSTIHQTTTPNQLSARRPAVASRGIAGQALLRDLLLELWEQGQVVLLIDEVDKADIEFPNDLLQELDKMEFYVYETGEMVKAKVRPIVVITSNNEKELPDAFLRRCFFHYIQFPDRETMQQIVDVHYPSIKQDLVKEALEIFFDVRKVPGLKKKPSTSELIDWLKLLMADDIPEEILTNRDTTKAIPPLYGALVKNEQDVQLLERLAFMNRRQSGGNSSGGQG